MTSEEFATRLLHEKRVAVVPGDAFGKCGEDSFESPMHTLLRT